MLRLRNLTKWYPTPHGRRYVFRELNFEFPSGKNIGLIGRNGAGKSTLMRLLAGIDTPNAGSIVTDARLSWPVGLSGGFQAALTGRENVQFVARIQGATGKAIAVVRKLVKGRFEVRVKKLAPDTGYDLLVGGIKVAALHTSNGGSAKVRFSSQATG